LTSACRKTFSGRSNFSASAADIFLAMHERHFGLDLCRALAIGLVLASHGRLFVESVLPAAGVLRVGGFLGVELFFVLSGFLIGTILYRDLVLSGGSDLGRFWVRRWMRTLPAYYLYLGLNILAGAAGLTTELPWDQLPAYVTFTQNLAWPHPLFFGEAWSLSVEEAFYLVLPALALALITLTGNRRRGFLLAVLLIGALSLLARIAVVLALDPAFDAGVRKIVVLRLDALMMGVLLAVVCLERPALSQVGQQPVVRIAALVLVVGAVAWSLRPLTQLDASVASRILLFVAASAACAALIVTSLSWRSQSGVVAQAVRKLALWSYSAYLANLLVRQLLEPVIDRGHVLAAWSGLALFLVGTLALSAITYRFVERPFLAWRDRLASAGGGRAVPGS
jgi:peptidoglycan/LPS O-acetylase OafA/YrhL